MNSPDAKNQDGELLVIQEVLRRSARRARLQRAWRGGWLGLLAGGGLWLLVLGCYKVFPLPASVLFGMGYVAAALVPLGFLAGGWRALTLAEMARWVDAKQHFQERLSTALEIAATAPAGNWRALLVADAAQCARKLEPRLMLPFHLPAVSRWVLVVLVIGAGLGFVPEYRSKAFLQKKRDAEALRETGRQLAELTRTQLAKHPPVLNPVRQNLEAVAELGDQLGQVKLTRSDAQHELANLADKLRQEAKLMAQNPALRRMEQAARTPGGQASEANPALQKQIEGLQNALGKQAQQTGALEKLRKDLQKAQQAAHKVGAKIDDLRRGPLPNDFFFLHFLFLRSAGCL
ncbi:MAG: hypothetical protein M1608_02695, partial [Candidatus Omnitrophica bacterium]|nr:hypothetical protein [Candidatus Omnitrophota bacterium]